MNDMCLFQTAGMEIASGVTLSRQGWSDGSSRFDDTSDEESKMHSRGSLLC